MFEKQTLKDTITFRETNNSKNMKLNGFDMSLFQVLRSLENENDCVSVTTTPPRIAMSTPGVINTSSNETIYENKVENDSVVTKVSPTVPIVRVGNNGCLKCYLCSEVVFNVSQGVLSDLGTGVLGK